MAEESLNRELNELIDREALRTHSRTLIYLFLFIYVIFIIGSIVYFNFDTVVFSFLEYFFLILIFEFILLEIIILSFLKRIKEKFFEETK